MGQIGPDITFDELKKQYLEAIRFLAEATTEKEILKSKNTILIEENERLKIWSKRISNKVEKLLKEWQELEE
ncbi:MAG: hypothetical protein BA863_10315 [Desulfovibrio sp. S3730MH75]|nr:MAG: hypothetical protein BA863_10315 [Desulfovibrio sp. S3730MH75]